jgi:hypothetical protein
MNLVELRELQVELRRAYLNNIISAKAYSLVAGEIGARIADQAALTADSS